MPTIFMMFAFFLTSAAAVGAPCFEYLYEAYNFPGSGDLIRKTILREQYRNQPSNTVIARPPEPQDWNASIYHHDIYQLLGGHSPMGHSTAEELAAEIQQFEDYGFGGVKLKRIERGPWYSENEPSREIPRLMTAVIARGLPLIGERFSKIFAVDEIDLRVTNTTMPYARTDTLFHADGGSAEFYLTEALYGPGSIGLSRGGYFFQVPSGTPIIYLAMNEQAELPELTGFFHAAPIYEGLRIFVKFYIRRRH